MPKEPLTEQSRWSGFTFAELVMLEEALLMNGEPPRGLIWGELIREIRQQQKRCAPVPPDRVLELARGTSK